MIAKTGRIITGITIAAFGILHFVVSHSLAGIMFLSTTVPLYWTYIEGTILTAAGLCIIAGFRTRIAAIVTGSLFLLLYLFYGPLKEIAHPYDPGAWTAPFELVALGGGVLLLAGIRAGKYLLAIALVIFGIQHFIYADFVANLITPWIPFKLFWAYFVGIAFFASAISMVTDIQLRLSSLLLGSMFLLWVLVLHGPLVIQHLREEAQWNSLFIALAMGGIFFVLADDKE